MIEKVLLWSIELGRAGTSKPSLSGCSFFVLASRYKSNAIIYHIAGMRRENPNSVSDMKSRDFLIWHLFGRHEIAANLIVAHLSLGGFQNSM